MNKRKILRRSKEGLNLSDASIRAVRADSFFDHDKPEEKVGDKIFLNEKIDDLSKVEGVEKIGSEEDTKLKKSVKGFDNLHSHDLKEIQSERKDVLKKIDSLMNPQKEKEVPKSPEVVEQFELMQKNPEEKTILPEEGEKQEQKEEHHDSFFRKMERLVGIKTKKEKLIERRKVEISKKLEEKIRVEEKRIKDEVKERNKLEKIKNKLEHKKRYRKVLEDVADIIIPKERVDEDKKKEKEIKEITAKKIERKEEVEVIKKKKVKVDKKKDVKKKVKVNKKKRVKKKGKIKVDKKKVKTKGKIKVDKKKDVKKKEKVKVNEKKKIKKKLLLV
jgi:hypothetical protein